MTLTFQIFCIPNERLDLLLDSTKKNQINNQHITCCGIINPTGILEIWICNNNMTSDQTSNIVYYTYQQQPWFTLTNFINHISVFTFNSQRKSALLEAVQAMHLDQALLGRNKVNIFFWVRCILTYLWYTYSCDNSFSHNYHMKQLLTKLSQY